MKANHEKQINFILERLLKGGNRATILQEFSTTFKNLTPRTFDSRLKIAKKHFQEQSGKIIQQTDEAIAKEVEARKSNIMNVIERQEVLSKIARGELEVERIMLIDGQLKKVKDKPAYNDMKGAIAELNKMGGDYAPAKSEISITDKPKIIFPGDEPTDD